MNTNEDYIKKIKYILYKLCILLSISVSIGICNQIIVRKSIIDIYTYVYTNTKVFGVEVFLILGILTFLYYIFNHLGISTLITGGTIVSVYIINYYKYILKGEYLGPGDLFLLKEASNISQHFEFNITPQILWGAGCLIWLVILTFILKEKVRSKIRRIVGSCLGGFIITISIGFALENTVAANIDMGVVNQNYENNGFLFTFINRLNELKIDIPDKYSKAQVNSIINNIEIQPQESVTTKPNIILIMNEAFYDPTELPNIQFSEDPVSFFRSLQAEYTGGNIITSIFGGSTAQTEYEILTGNSVDFTGKDNIAYTRYIYEGMPSMVNILNSLGYESIAIHPYKKEFYSRDVVYSELGFDRFFSEKDFEEAEKTTTYISDRELYKKIIGEYEIKKQEKSNPMFIHAVTMQNHGPYSSPYDEHNITVEGERLSSDTKQLLERYSNLLKESDQALQELIDYFSKINEPTIIIMFGDHGPVVGEDYALYRELGVFSDVEDVQSNYIISHTPYMIWNNYGQKINSYTNIDASYLGSILLSEANMNCDTYFTYLYNQIHLLKAFNEKFYIDELNRIKSIEELSDEESNILEELWVLQYDRIFGERYIDDNDKDE